MKKIILLSLTLISACTTIEAKRGSEIREQNISQITPSTTKQQVFDLLGSPSTKSNFGQESWYYISNNTKRQILSENEVLNQEVVAVTFNESGTVDNVEIYDNNDARDIAFSDRETPTAGKKLGMIEQILGNVGKFNTDGEGDVLGQRSPGGTRPY